jgi:hypothetical protein
MSLDYFSILDIFLFGLKSLLIKSRFQLAHLDVSCKMDNIFVFPDLDYPILHYL